MVAEADAVGGIAVVTRRSRPSPEDPPAVNPESATTCPIMPPEVDVCTRARALNCGFHTDSAASTEAAGRPFCGFVSFSAR